MHHEAGIILEFEDSAGEDGEGDAFGHGKVGGYDVVDIGIEGHVLGDDAGEFYAVFGGNLDGQFHCGGIVAGDNQFEHDDAAIGYLIFNADLQRVG